MSIKGQSHSLTFAKGQSVFKLQNIVSQKIIEIFETKWKHKNENSYKRAWSHYQDGLHAHIW